MAFHNVLRSALIALFLTTALTACAAGSQAKLIPNPFVEPIEQAQISAKKSSAPRVPSSSAPKASIGSSSSAIARPAAVRIPILVYHHLRSTKGYPKSTWSYKMSVSPDIFEKQMQWIADHGYQTIDLDTAAAILKGEQVGPAKPIVITFDDNNPTQYTVGVPILQKYKQMAVFYLISSRLENKSFISADQVREMSRLGMDIESHTVSHAMLTNLSLKAMDAQLAESRRVLEELIGKPVRHLSYPLTTSNATVRTHTEKAGYITGTIMDPRVATPKDSLFKLPRIMMIDTTDLKKVLP